MLCANAGWTVTVPDKSDTPRIFGSKMAEFGSKLAERELPSKTIAKNFASLITYPHSERKRFENRSARARL
jgi:hypothetical protein